jgi:hypothetical protein
VPVDTHGKLFFAYALIRKRLRSSASLDSLPEIIENIGGQIEQHVNFQGTTRSSVPGTESIAYLAKTFNNQPLQIIHRYDEASLVDWLRAFGMVVNSRSRPLSVEADIHDTVLILSRNDC